MSPIILPLFGFLIGIIASLTGVGGGILIVPLLTNAYNFTPQHAIGTSLMTIIFTAVAATISYSRQSRVLYRLGLFMAMTTIPGAYLGAYLTTVISPRTLGLIFGAFIALVSLEMLRGKGSAEKDRNNLLFREIKQKAEEDLTPGTTVFAVGLSFFAGLISGFLGVGGGILAVPIMTLILHLPIHLATATSMFTMIFTSISGVVKHGLSGHVHLVPALTLALGTVFGARVGAHISRRLSGRGLRQVFAVILFLVGLQMVLKFLK